MEVKHFSSPSKSKNPHQTPSKLSLSDIVSPTNPENLVKGCGSVFWSAHWKIWDSCISHTCQYPREQSQLPILLHTTGFDKRRMCGSADVATGKRRIWMRMNIRLLPVIRSHAHGPIGGGSGLPLPHPPLCTGIYRIEELHCISSLFIIRGREVKFVFLNSK